MNRSVTMAALASLGAFALGIYACSDDAGETATTGEPSAGTGGNTNAATSANGGGDVSVGVNVGGSTGEGGSCADLVVEASVEFKPADIIFVIDNSGSMSEEINSVEQNINVNFASIIQSSGIDYRVIMVTDHGTGSYDVCIGPPLSNTTDCAGPPQNVANQFYHYSVNVQSHDSVCKIFNTFYGPMGGGEADFYNLEPNGWNAWLRPEAVKVFVEITDDGISCTHQSVTYNDGDTSMLGQTFAYAFDDKLLSMAPGQFGTSADRNYIFYSIVGLAPKMAPNQLDPYTEFEAIIETECSGGVGPGTGYQWLSKGTGALRFPVCNYQSYDVVFQDIASGVIDVTKVPCEFDVPPPPPGQELDLDTIDVLYTPGGGGQAQVWTKVDSESQCGPGKFWIDETVMPPRIHLCDAACQVVEADTDATLEVKIECGGAQN